MDCKKTKLRVTVNALRRYAKVRGGHSITPNASLKATALVAAWSAFPDISYAASSSTSERLPAQSTFDTAEDDAVEPGVTVAMHGVAPYCATDASSFFRLFAHDRVELPPTNFHLLVLIFIYYVFRS